MKTSIVIPVLNEASTIEEALRCASRQDGNVDIIVVDGGSSDGTAAIAGRHARVISSPRGRARQMNAGAADSTADTLVFVHADTKLPHGAVKEIERSLSDPTVIGGRFSVRLDEQGWRYRLVGASINLRDRVVGGFTGDQAIFIRRLVFHELGGYRDMPLMEDLEFGRRMCRRGKVIRLPMYVVTSARRWKRNGVLRTILLMWALKILYALGCPPRHLQRLYGDTR